MQSSRMLRKATPKEARLVEAVKKIQGAVIIPRDIGNPRELTEEMARKYAELMTTEPLSLDPIVTLVRREGYKTLRVRVLDDETGQAIYEDLFTVRRPDDYVDFLSKLLVLLQWPEAALQKLIVGYDPKLKKSAKFLHVLRKQILGGRPPGRSERTSAEYADIVKMYHESNLTVKDFCERTEIKRGRLYAAIRSQKSAGKR